MPAFQFAAQSYTSRSAPLDSQRSVNMFVERSPAQAKTQVPIFMCPGLDYFSRLGTGPINAMHVMADTLYALSGGELFSINADGLATSLGMTTLGGIVSTADNETQLVMVDGSVGWVYQVGGLNQILLNTALDYTMTNTTATASTGATSVTVISAARFASGDKIGVALDNGSIFSTTISGAPSGNVITLAAALPSKATAGAAVYDYSVGGNQITLASIGNVAVGANITITLDNGLPFTTTITAKSGIPSSLIVTLAAGLPSQASAGAIATVVGANLGQITAPAFQPASTVVYFDDYFVFDAAGTNQWFLSGLGDGTQYNGLDFASAESNPDLVLAVVNYHEQLLIFGEKGVEVWIDQGSVDFPFVRFGGAYIQRGLAAPLAITQEDNTVFWLGDDGIFYRLNGYSPQRISTFGTEHAWAQYGGINDVSCFVLNMEGHKFIFLTFPQGNPNAAGDPLGATWCYDISTGTQEPLWHERESWGSPWL